MADIEPPPSVDTSRPPLGELAARQLIEALVRTDDRAERHYLEVKSEVDLTRTLGAAKIAKFVLGAANRDPAIAQRAFGGYAVLVIGVAPGETPGVPPIEVGEIEMRVRPFLSVGGPRWDVVRVPVTANRDVLLVVVDPPQPGQPPFLCWKQFSPDRKEDAKHSLQNGGIYVRAEGATRPATAEETAALIERGKGGASPDVDVEVSLEGVAVRPATDPYGRLAAYVDDVAANLAAKLPGSGERSDTHLTLVEMAAAKQLQDTVSKFSRLSQFDWITGGTVPENRTREQYTAEIDDWADGARAAIPEFLDDVVATVVPPVVVRVANRARTFFEDTELTLHLAGNVDGLEPREEELRRGLWPARPPRTWGPRSGPHPLAGIQSLVSYAPSSPLTYGPRSLTWENGGSITLTWSIGDLRPRETRDADPDDSFVLVVRDPSLEVVHGTWELTARGHHDVYEGELDLPVSGPVNVADEVQGFLERIRQR